ncbi:MAG: YidC/Oxa1 family membrane protein insertase [Patescibacteria group bacterium]|jgi:YidC/Oxa1 family membrane protein insertase
MTALYTSFFYQPIFNLLVFLYNVLPGTDLGVAIVLLTILIRLLLYPLSLKSIRAQRGLQELQPKLDAIKKQYPGNREKQAEETMKLYREEKINPLSSCLPLLLQLPFLLALFHVLRNVTDPSSLQDLYSFVARPALINPVGFFGLLNLNTPNVLVALLAGAAQFWQGHMLSRRRPEVKDKSSKDEDFSAMVNQQMTYIMPVATIAIAWRFPSGVGIYWFLSTFLLALQQWYIFRKKKTPTATYEDKQQQASRAQS